MTDESEEKMINEIRNIIRDKVLWKIIIASFLSVGFYYGTVVLLGEVRERLDCIIPSAVLFAMAVMLMLGYALLYVWSFHVMNGTIRLSLRSGEYGGAAKDILNCAKSGRALFLAVLLINIFCWAMMKAGLYTANVIRIFEAVFIPLNPLILAHGFDVLSYITSSVLIYVFYVLILAAARKITYNKMFPKNKT